jgi:hypothetical protein
LVDLVMGKKNLGRDVTVPVVVFQPWELPQQL